MDCCHVSLYVLDAFFCFCIQTIRFYNNCSTVDLNHSSLNSKCGWPSNVYLIPPETNVCIHNMLCLFAFRLR